MMMIQNEQAAKYIVDEDTTGNDSIEDSADNDDSDDGDDDDTSDDGTSDDDTSDSDDDTSDDDSNGVEVVRPEGYICPLIDQWQFTGDREAFVNADFDDLRRVARSKSAYG
jgi:hypothetical protein